ncbi:MAG: esterase-like activity of phytase family protein [Planctomycetota bacterium]
MRALLGLTLLGVGLCAGQEPARIEVEASVDCAALFGPGVYEASGLTLAEGRLHVVFDNLARVASVGQDLDPGSASLSPGRAGFSDYEGIAHDPETGALYVAVEAERVGREQWRPRILQLDARGEVQGSWSIPRDLTHDNKGVEGLCCLRREGRAYLLALLEGNHGEGGDRGRERGHGRLLVLGATADGWALERELALPPSAAFEDYAGIDVRGERVAIVSQTSAALWLGELGADWTLSEGVTLPFPRQPDGSLRFARVEGVAWLDDARLALCSDQERPRDRGLGRAEQALHLVRLVSAEPARQGGLAGSLDGGS